MEKKDIKNILISMRTAENEAMVNNLLGKIDMMDSNTLQETIRKIGNDEASIRGFLKSKLSNIHEQQTDEKYPINSMFTYGISGNCIHLHLPVDLHQMISKYGVSATIANVNLQLIDAIDKIKRLKDDGFYRFSGKDSIYMISPILIGREMKFLNEIGFRTRIHSKKDLKDPKYVEKTPEAKLANHIFGSDKNVGTAIIDFDTMSKEEWKQIINEKTAELEHKAAPINISEKTLN